MEKLIALKFKNHAKAMSVKSIFNNATPLFLPTYDFGPFAFKIWHVWVDN
jgi:hypothetical protein